MAWVWCAWIDWKGAESVSEFLSNLSIVFVFNSLAFFLQFCVLILVARAWGPVLYGQVTLIGNITALLFIPFSMGVNNAMYKFLPVTEEQQHQELIDTAILGNIANVICLSSIFLLSYSLFAHILTISFEVWICALVYSIATNFVCIFESFLRGKRRFFAIGKIRIVSSLLFFCTMLFLVLFMNKESLSYYYGSYLIFYMLTFVALVTASLRISFSHFQWKLYLQINKYGLMMMMGLLITAFLYNSDIIILNSLVVDKENVGVFASYQGIVKLLFYMGFHEIFTVVFLPTIARMDRKEVFHKLKKLSVFIFAIVTLAAACVIAITLLFFGNKYGFSLFYLTLASVNIGMFTLFQLYNAIISMEGDKGARLSFVVALLVLPAAFTLQILLTRSWGISGIMLALVATNICLLGLMYISVNRFYQSQPAYSSLPRTINQ
jgi:O-antigen/teichoic acid export membrane protein